jgi:hypothetical protein
MSERKPRQQRKDKLPPSEKHARHLEASRKYYSRYFLFFVVSICCLLFFRNKQRIKQEQLLRSRKLVISFVRVCATTHG